MKRYAGSSIASHDEFDIVCIRRRLVKRLYAVRHDYRLYSSKLHRPQMDANA
ncbi:MAG: hypothetical protein ACI35Z_15530 [Sphingobacterium hotanense]